jgi:arylsulfatase A-like enzyme
MNVFLRAGVGVLLACAAACTRAPSELGCGELELGQREHLPNVLLVVGDTWRRDAASTYGGNAATPGLERVARRGILFTRAYSTAPWTKPAVASLFTGLEPSAHGVLSHLDEHGRGIGVLETDVLAPELTTLAELYQRAGYATGAVLSNPWLVRPYGFDQGFDAFEDSLAHWHASASDVTLAASLWLSAQSTDRPWFLYVHYLDPHRPYGPLDEAELRRLAREIAADTRPVDDEALKAIEGQTRLADGRSALEIGIEPRLRLLELAYEKGIERFDAGLASLLDAVEARADSGRTAIVVTSDHGESLYERGVGNHGTLLYDDEVAIPLVMHLPGASPQPAVDHCTTSLAGLMDLLCRYSQIDCDGAGTSEPGTARLGGVTAAPARRGIVVDQYKLIWQRDAPANKPEFRLFDLARDPSEQHDVASEEPEVVGRLRARIEARSATEPATSPRAELPADAVDRLRELGYGS